MPAPSTSVLFDGTTVTGLSNDPLHSSSTAFTVSGGVFVPHTYSEMWAASPTWTGDGEAWCEIPTIGTGAGGGAFAGVIQQPSASSSTADGYQVGYLWGASPKIEVYRYTNVAFTTIISTGITALSNGDAIWLLVQAGTVYAYYRRSGTWTLAGSVADSTYTFAGGGAVAEWAIFDSNNVARLDNLGGGAVSSGTTDTLTLAAGSLGRGTAPSAAVGVGVSGALGRGVAVDAAIAAVAFGGAIGGGFAPSDSTSTVDTLTVGAGSLGRGTAPSALASAGFAGALGRVTTPVPIVGVNAGGALGRGSAPSAIVIVGQKGSIVGGGSLLALAGVSFRGAIAKGFLQGASDPSIDLPVTLGLETHSTSIGLESNIASIGLESNVATIGIEQRTTTVGIDG